ncbi:hypothetical protein M2175_005524 [Bradyrhizobium elkanii]|nr:MULTISPECIES: hypothetical protein [Bradyrhizobium]MCS3930493.1 hypothetical protein [Bradyrhizobium elkanii]MCS3971050.1 hypothetical protein [Bradyrhizobium japonicum]
MHAEHLAWFQPGQCTLSAGFQSSEKRDVAAKQDEGDRSNLALGEDGRSGRKRLAIEALPYGFN